MFGCRSRTGRRGQSGRQAGQFRNLDRRSRFDHSFLVGAKRAARPRGGHWLGPALYYEIRYELLVDRPAEQCAALCDFLGLTYDDAMPQYYEDRTKADPEVDAAHPRLPVTTGLRDWRSQMPAEDVERFEAAAGGLLDELGYPRAFPRPRNEKLENASRIRRLLAQDPRWRRLSEGPRPNAAGVSAS